MTITPIAARVAALVFCMSAAPAFAGPIERACLSSNRDGVNRPVCSCIQQIADQTLGGSDQRRAAKLFNDPDQANDVWLSKKSADDAFWDRYKDFGSQVEAYCAGI